MILTPEQRSAVERRAPLVCVSAAAGSGKTGVLVNRVIHLLEDADQPGNLDRIVAITFTEKAAAEMKSRLRKAFRERATEGQRDTMNRWRSLERQLESARIETIHAFCTRVLKEHALRVGLDPDFGIMDEAEGFIALDEMLRTMLHNLLEREDPAAFRMCCEQGFVETQRLLRRLLKSAHTLEHILAMPEYDDPSELAEAWRMKTDLEQRATFEYMRHHPDTRKWLNAFLRFDGMCSNPDHGWEKNRLASICVLENLQSGAPIHKINSALETLRSLGARGGTKKDWIDENELEKLKAILKKFKSDDSSWLQRHFPVLELLPEIEAQSAVAASDLVSLCRRAKELHMDVMTGKNRLDFDALIARVRKFLEEDPEFRKHIAKKFDYFLMDEFQDTDSAQMRIVELLAQCESGPSLFVVGDVKQSIYYFRGAEVGVFNALQTRTEHSLRLTENFRTLDNIIQVVNHFFAESVGLYAVEPEYTPMKASRGAVDYPCVELLMQDLTINPDQTDAQTRRKSEAHAIAARIRALCAPGAPAIVRDTHTGEFRTPKHSDIALLFRALSDVHLYEHALRLAGIPYVLISGGGFFERQEVLDILNLLKVVLDPFNDMAILAFLRSPMGALHDESLYYLAKMGSLSVVVYGDTEPENFTQSEDFLRARRLLHDLTEMKDMPVAQMLRHIFQETQYEAALLSQFMGVQKVSNLRKLLALAENAGDSLDLRAFVRYLDEVRSTTVRESDAAVLPEGADTVSLMTVHKSKGLEFPIVFIPDMGRDTSDNNKIGVYIHKDLGLAMRVIDEMGESQKPMIAQLISSRIKREEEAESWRALYVAMTRARDYLVLCGNDDAKGSSWFGAILESFRIEEPAQGEVIRRGDAALIVSRGVAVGMEVKAESPSASLAFDSDVEPMLGAIPETSVGIRQFSVSTLLHHMADGFDEHEARQSEDEPAPGRASAKAMLRGDIVHRMFEFFDFKGGTAQALDDILDEACVPAEERAEMLSDLESIAARFLAQPIAGRIAQSRRLRRELPFQYKLDNVLLNGKIDALIDDEILLDYKTGRFNEERHARYEWQLLLYAAALRDLNGAVPKQAFLYYADEGRLMPLDLDAGQIENALRQAREIVAQIS